MATLLPCPRRRSFIASPSDALNDVEKKPVPDFSSPVVVGTKTVQPVAKPELLHPLSELEFNVLLEGERRPSDDNLRAVFVGVFASVALGLVAIYFTPVTWADIVKRGPTAIMLYWGVWAALGFSLVIIALTTMRIRSIKGNPLYQSVIKNIHNTYHPEQPSNLPPG